MLNSDDPSRAIAEGIERDPAKSVRGQTIEVVHGTTVAPTPLAKTRRAHRAGDDAGFQDVIEIAGKPGPNSQP